MGEDELLCGGVDASFEKVLSGCLIYAFFKASDEVVYAEMAHGGQIVVVNGSIIGAVDILNGGQDGFDL